VVYRLPLSCGKAYVGQTSKCVNERLTEHSRARKLKIEEYKTLTMHTDECGCKALPEQATTLGESGRPRITREILEAFWIKKEEFTTISEPSTSLSDREFEMLLKVADTLR